MTETSQFLSGAIFMGYAVAGLFFLKFWRRTRDPLFLAFAVAVWALAAMRIVLSSLSDQSELRFFIYSGRLVPYALILWGVFQKNRNLFGSSRDDRTESAT